MSFYGVDTRGPFIGHSPRLREAIDRAVAIRYGDCEFDNDIPATLEYLFTQRLIESLTGREWSSEDAEYVEMVYAAIDCRILRHAVNVGHVKRFKINRYGYYIANWPTDGGQRVAKPERANSRSRTTDQRSAPSSPFRGRSS